MDSDFINIIINYHKGRCSDEELQKLYYWIKENRDNKRMFDEISDLWFSSALFSDRKDFNAKQAFSRLHKKIEAKERTNDIKNKKSTISIIKPMLRIAAIFVFAFTLGGIAIHYIANIQDQSDKEFTSIKIPNGSKSEIVLPDGSKIWLNAGSELTYRTNFNVKNREVNISGEGYFDITKNQDLPFTVKAENIMVEVLGTEFNLKAYPEEGLIQTTLVEGSLALIKEDKNGKKTKTILKPNQKVTYVKKSGKMFFNKEEKNNINLAEVDKMKGKLLLEQNAEVDIITSWKDNRLIFRNEPFEGLVTKLERWYNVQIDVKDDEIKNYHFNGTIENETIQEVLEFIKYTLPIDYSIKNNTIAIFKKDKKPTV